MPSPRWTKILRDLWLHKARTLLVVSAIAVGIAGAGSVLNTRALLRRVIDEQFAATNPPSATLQVEGLDARMLATVRAVPGVLGAEARRTVTAAVSLGDATRTAVLFAGDNLSTQSVGKLEREAGAWPPAAGEFVIEKSSVEFAGLKIGDSVTIRVAKGPVVRLPVTGIAHDPGVAPGWMEHVVYGFVTTNTLARLGVPAVADELQILVQRDASRSDVRRTAYDVKVAVEASGARVMGIDVPEPGEHIHAGQIDSLLLIQGAFGVIALALSAFLVVNLIAAMLAGQVREIGIMKTIGAQPGQLTAMYLAVALLLGLAAAVVAIPLAAVVGRLYAAFAAEMLNFEVTGQAIPAWSILAQLGVAMTLPVVAAAVPVLRGCRIPVADALRDVGIRGSADGDSGGIFRASGLARPVLLSIRNAFRRRGRMVLTLATLSFGGAVFIGALGVRTAIRRASANIFGEVLRYDIALRLGEGHAPESIESAIAKLEGVEAVESWSGARAAVAHGGGVSGNFFSLTGLPVQTRLVRYPVLQGRWLDESDDRAIVVSRALAMDEPSLVAGTTVSLVIDGKASEWRIVGVVDAGVSSSAFTTRRTLASATGDSRARSAVVAAAEAVEPRELTDRIRGALEGGPFRVTSANLTALSRASFEDHVLMVAAFLVVMSQLTIVVGGLGLASTMSLSVLERTREIGVLRAIGASHGAIMWMVQVEGLVVALLSWMIAIPLSIPMTIILSRAFGDVFVPLPPTYLPGIPALGAWLLVATVVSLIASAWPARHATRVTTAAALAYE
jgi:putative ABC transport system permease protein